MDSNRIACDGCKDKIRLTKAPFRKPRNGRKCVELTQIFCKKFSDNIAARDAEAAQTSQMSHFSPPLLVKLNLTTYIISNITWL